MRALLHSVAPTMLGAAIYVLWRSPRLIVFRWLGVMGLNGAAFAMRHRVAWMKPSVPGFVLYSLPDALWVYAFTAALALIWWGRPGSWQRRVWLCLPAALGIGSEVGQRWHVVPGTFDWSDIAGYGIAGALAVWLPTLTVPGVGALRQVAWFARMGNWRQTF